MVLFFVQLLQLFTSSLFLAGMLGGACASWTTSRLGRVRTMLIAGLFFLVGAVLMSCAVSTVMLVLGRGVFWKKKEVSLGLGVDASNEDFLFRKRPPTDCFAVRYDVLLCPRLVVLMVGWHPSNPNLFFLPQSLLLHVAAVSLGLGVGAANQVNLCC